MSVSDLVMGQSRSGHINIDYDEEKKKRTGRYDLFNQDPHTPRPSEQEVTVKLKNRFVREISVRQFNFISDEPKDVGGTDTAPRPMEYFLTGAALAEITSILAHSIDLGVKLNDIKIRAKAHRDLRGRHQVGGIRAGWDHVTYDVEIDSAADERTIQDLISSSQDICPGYDSMIHPIKIQTNIVLNGKKI